jgi:hypothetical protein
MLLAWYPVVNIKLCLVRTAPSFTFQKKLFSSKGFRIFKWIYFKIIHLQQPFVHDFAALRNSWHLQFLAGTKYGLIITQNMPSIVAILPPLWLERWHVSESTFGFFSFNYFSYIKTCTCIFKPPLLPAIENAWENAASQKYVKIH